MDPGNMSISVLEGGSDRKEPTVRGNLESGAMAATLTAGMIGSELDKHSHNPEVVPEGAVGNAEELLDFVGGFVAEAAKGNLIMFSVILGGFGIFFTERIFWLTFGIIALDAFLGLYAPCYKLPLATEEDQRKFLRLGAMFRSHKFFQLGFPLLAFVVFDEISHSTNCDDVCKARGKLALILGLTSLLLLETLPMVFTSCLTHFRTPASQWLVTIFEHPFLIYQLFCGAASACITTIILLIVGGSYAIFMSWQSFALCWVFLATELIVEGTLRTGTLVRWRMLFGLVVRLVLHVTAFICLIIHYKHLGFVIPALDTSLCDGVCQKRLEGLLSGLTILCGVQAAATLYAVAGGVVSFLGGNPSMLLNPVYFARHNLSTGHQMHPDRAADTPQSTAGEPSHENVDGHATGGVIEGTHSDTSAASDRAPDQSARAAASPEAGVVGPEVSTSSRNDHPGGVMIYEQAEGRAHVPHSSHEGHITLRNAPEHVSDGGGVCANQLEVESVIDTKETLLQDIELKEVLVE